jgi:1-deoxy-D-xylulose 5-phosphate reductoisomerase
MAVELFLDERLPFTAIPLVIEEALSAHTPVAKFTIDDLVRADADAREFVRHHAPNHIQ